MMNWLQQLVAFILSVAGTIIGAWVFTEFIFPRMMKKSTRKTIDEAAKHPKIAPIIEEAKPILTRFKKLLDKAEQVDWKETADMLKGLKVFIELQNKPPPPPPPEKKE